MEYYIYGLIFIVFGIVAFMPYYSKQDILFGYRITEELAERVEARQIKRAFVVIVFGILLASTLVILLLRLNFGFLVAGFLLGEYVAFFTARRRAKDFVERNREEIKTEKRVVVSTAPRNIGVSPYWFLINVVIIAAAFLFALTYYEQIPDRFPTRYDFQGNITGYEEKSWGTVLMFPIIITVMTLLMFYCFSIIGKAKEELSGKDVAAAQKRSRLFKKFTARMLVYISLIMSTFFFYNFLQMIQVIPFQLRLNKVMMFVFPVLIIFPVIISAVLMGQGGSRIKLKKYGEQMEVVRADDDYWKWGMIYYNPEDPSLWVDKRYGVGWTMNFARPGAWIFMAVILGFVVLSLVLPML